MYKHYLSKQMYKLHTFTSYEVINNVKDVNM